MRNDIDRHDIDHVASTFRSYDAARRAANLLLDGDLSAEDVVISARGIRVEERLLPTSWFRVAVDAAVRGGMVGLFVGFFLGLFSLSAPGVSAMILGTWGALFGAAAGLLVGVLFHALRRDDQTHVGERSLTADYFDLCVPTSHAHAAATLLRGPEAREPAGV